jgi:molybdopterin converting factor subunit 1
VIMLTVRLFASLKDRAGRPQVDITLADPATVSTLKEALAEAYPDLAPALSSALVAVNQEFAFATTPVAAGDEVALFPPVSGGSQMEPLPYPTYFALTADVPDINELTRRLVTPSVGAVVFFQGWVRGETARDGLPPETLYLEYEAYAGMAQKKMVQIAREIWDKWPQVQGVALVQRIGRLEVGDPTTFVACASGHRDQGVFTAARYGIDRLKEIVPVWKKEVGRDRSVWVEGDYRPGEADIA